MRLFKRRQPKTSPTCEELGLRLEADKFAREMLMPEEAVRDLWKYYPHVNQIARHFRVPEDQMELRIVELGLTDRAKP